MTAQLGVAVRQWAWAGVPFVGALFVLLFVALPPASIPQSVVYDAVGLATVAIALLGIRIHRPAGRLPWLLLAAGQLAFVVGDVIWTAFDANGIDPFPSAADGAYLIGYPLLAIGLAIAIGRRIRGGDRSGLLDGAILATGAALLWWTFVLGPVAGASDPAPLAFWISVAYPIGDLLLIGMAMTLVMIPGLRSPAFALLIANLLILLVGDLAFGVQTVNGTYVDGGILDTLWLWAYIAFATAAMHPSMAQLFDPRPVPVVLLGPARLVLMAGAMLVGPILLVLDPANAGATVWVVGGATALLSVLVVTRLAGIVGHLARDIERRAALEAQLSYQAFHDPLTGLANRRRFVHAVTESLASRTGSAVLFLDLDDFKDVNDLMGHDAGDALLSSVGHRLLAAIRPDDLGCRLGGDEFAVLLPATAERSAAEGVATRLVAAIAEPVEIEHRTVHVSASVGVAVLSQGESVTVDEALRRADVAMYQAKARGKHRVATYGPELEATPDATAAGGPHVRRGPALPSAPAA